MGGLGVMVAWLVGCCLIGEVIEVCFIFSKAAKLRFCISAVLFSGNVVFIGVLMGLAWVDVVDGVDCEGSDEGRVLAIMFGVGVLVNVRAEMAVAASTAALNTHFSVNSHFL
jgi:hypothetical protein